MPSGLDVIARARRTVRSKGGDLIRRWGWLPGGVPDGIGDDAELLGTRLDARVVVYYAGTERNLYQLRQWYAPLVALGEHVPVLLMCADSRVGRVLRDEAPLPSVTVGRFATIDDLVSRSDVAMFCYVGHEAPNFQVLRVTSALHVYLTHGESDKLMSVTNQVKAYDYVFVAGQGTIDRFAEHVLRFDAERHVRTIGRPQLDAVTPGPRERAEGEPWTVLYAPTWEGAQGTSEYSSVVSHGQRIVDAVLADPRLRLVYRPHPRTGANRADFEAADRAVRARLAASGGRGRLDPERDPVDSFAHADVLVSDVSAITLDWLATGRPLLVTEPASATTVVARTRLLDEVPRVPADGVEGLAERIVHELEADPGRAARTGLWDYYFGERALGTGTQRFVRASLDVVAERDELATRRADRPSAPPPADGDDARGALA